MMTSEKPLFEVPDGIQTRWASPENWDGEKGAGGQFKNGRKGSPCFRLPPGESRILAHAENTSGTIRRIWMTLDDRTPAMLRGMRIDMFWDGADQPAVSAPLGDFFGQGLGRNATFESALFSNPEGRSFNCCIPMPFRTGMKIIVTNESEVHLEMLFYDINYTLGDQHDENAMYFHAHWRRERPTTLLKDYEFLPKVEGKGRFIGVNCGVIADTEQYFKSWWGEGEAKIFLDGDEEFPTLCGTGTEDYIGTGWGQEQYAHLYQGCHLADAESYQYAFYRFHIPDPVYFYQDIRVTMHQIGCWGPDIIEQTQQAGRELLGTDGRPVDLQKELASKSFGLFEREDDWSSCAYFYLDRPTNGLPALASVEDRIIGLLETENAKVRLDA